MSFCLGLTSWFCELFSHETNSAAHSVTLKKIEVFIIVCFYGHITLSVFFASYVKIRIINCAMSILRNVTSGYTVEYATTASSLSVMALT